MNNPRLVFTAIVFVAVFVLVLVREADPPIDGKCFVKGDCDWGDLAPDAEIMPGVTAKEFSKFLREIVDAVTGPVQKIYDDPGGTIGGHWDLYRFYAGRGAKYEVLGECASACTLVLGVIDKPNLCVGPKASFRFHQAYKPDSPHAIAVETTQWMVDQLPADIQAWIEKKGGVKNMPSDDVWILWPSEIWAMGYRKCEAAQGKP